MSSDIDKLERLKRGVPQTRGSWKGKKMRGET